MSNVILPFFRYARSLAFFRFLILAGLGFFLMLLFSIPYIPRNEHLTIGDISKIQLISPRYLEVETTDDKKTTEHLRNKTAESIENVYIIDEAVGQNIEQSLIEFFIDIRKSKTDNTPFHTANKQLNKVIPAADLRYIRNLPDDALSLLQSMTVQSAKNVLSHGLRTIYSSETTALMETQINKLSHSVESKKMITELLNAYLIPNQKYSDEETIRRRNSERQRIPPQKTVIKSGQPILYPGDQITNRHLELLAAAGLYNVSIQFQKLLPIMMMIIFMLFLFERYLFFFKPAIFNSIRLLLLTCITEIFLAFTVMGIMELSHLSSDFHFEYSMPIAFFMMMVGILIDVELAIFLLVLNSVFLGIVFTLPLNFIFFMILIGLASSFFTFQLNDRRDFVKAGVFLGLLSSFIIVMVEWITGTIQIKSLLISASLGFGNGLISAAITLGLLPYLEDLFRIITPMKLLDLTNQDTPLLRELLSKAPGTYHHSMMVASLAEPAAKAIKANAILTRVAAYYHDIGKIKRPSFFIENQTKGQNPHNKITPQLSSLIILSHPGDGMEMAKQQRLPKNVVELIGQHHGTSLLSFFYYKILRQDNMDDVDETQFRYSGKKPESKEAVILMIADAVEAAIRTIDRITPAKIETMIDKIIKEKFDDSQFDQADITMKDIYLIKHSFLKTLYGIHHARIEYPTP